MPVRTGHPACHLLRVIARCLVMQSQVLWIPYFQDARVRFVQDAAGTCSGRVALREIHRVGRPLYWLEHAYAGPLQGKLVSASESRILLCGDIPERTWIGLKRSHVHTPSSTIDSGQTTGHRVLWFLQRSPWFAVNGIQEHLLARHPMPHQRSMYPRHHQGPDPTSKVDTHLDGPLLEIEEDNINSSMTARQTLFHYTSTWPCASSAFGGTL